MITAALAAGAFLVLAGLIYGVCVLLRAMWRSWKHEEREIALKRMMELREHEQANEEIARLAARDRQEQRKDGGN